MKTLLSLLLLSTMMPLLGSAQEGCTDSQAINYDPSATVNDGSCIYPPTQYSPLLITEFDSSLSELSGLVFIDGKLLALNDGGNPASLYLIDTLTGELQATFTLSNLSNIDWEDLAQSPEYVYIGDFGNNNGDRTDLRIIRLRKSELLAGVLNPEIIQFSYSDQTDFTPAPNANNYDCEAFFWHTDSLHLFSKNWLDEKTRHYTLADQPGTQIAHLRDSFDIGGLVTSADISDKGVIALLAIGKSFPMVSMTLLFDYPDQRFFGGNKRRIDLGFVTELRQAEAIAFSIQGRGFIGSEELLSAFSAALFKFESAQWTEPVVAVDEEPALPFAMALPNPFSDVLEIYLPKGYDQPFRVRLVDMWGRPIFSEQFEDGAGRGFSYSWSADSLPTADGLYLLLVEKMDSRPLESILLMKKERE
ncbi:MAG: hypothetical protein KatS3mg029_0529 [Saprospiraceae bacterium]|nr:MAG: hypothetical protein KatS3mg029_0529 [Saprospiraceae bacterium]